MAGRWCVLTCGRASTHKPGGRSRPRARPASRPSSAQLVHRPRRRAGARRRASLGAARIGGGLAWKRRSRLGRGSEPVGAGAAARRRTARRLSVAAVLLDTTVLIDLLRGRPGTLRRLRALRDAGDSLHACAVNVEEIVRGLRGRDDAGARRLFSGLQIVPLGVAEGWRAGEWRRTFASRGRTLSQADCLVAAAAFSLGGRLATGNPKDFPMRELAVDRWPAGE